MTATDNRQVEQAVELVTLTIDGIEVSVPKDTLVIRAAEEVGIEIPRFCDHPLLDPVGACRQCLVDVATPDREGNVKPMPKPQASCTIAVSEGMQVSTQLTSAVADKAQQGVMELLLINHPLDCPVCDKGGECPLQNQAMSHGRPTSRFEDVKRTYPKPINISSQVLLDRERCVLCARCTRFSEQIAGDPFIALVERGALQQVGIYEEQPFESYFSGNTIQICPVGALTSAAYRFRSRPFDLVSTPSVCEHCASGCSLRVDHRRGTVLRRMAGNDPDVNEEWNCDKGRWAFTYASLGDRLELPLVSRDGEHQVVSWQDALDRAAGLLEGTVEVPDAGLEDSGREDSGTTTERPVRAAVLTGGRITTEDAYAYGKFARTVLGTNDIDFRARPASAEEADFLGSRVVSGNPEAGAVTYRDLESASSVTLVGFEAEEEAAIVFLRLRKAHREHGLPIYAVAPLATRGLEKVAGVLLPTAPGAEPEVLTALAGSAVLEGGFEQARAALAEPGAVMLLGARLAAVPGALTAAVALADATGARLAWMPRRAGERGALEAGALPGLLPGGRHVTDPQHLMEASTVWESERPLSGLPGRDTAAIIEAAADGEIDVLVVGGVDADDLAHPRAREAFRRASVISLEVLPSTVTEHADVVLPVAPHAEKSGTFIDWEGRPRPFVASLETNAVSDHRALHMLADAMGHFLGTRTLAEIRGEMDRFAPIAARGPLAEPVTEPAGVSAPGEGQFVLATWRQLLDEATLQRGEPFLAGTAKTPRARLSFASAEALGVTDGDVVTVSGDGVRVTAPVEVAEMVDRVVWLPTNSRSCDLRPLTATAGALVTVTAGGAA